MKEKATRKKTITLKKSTRDLLSGYLFSLPALIIFAVFMLYPVYESVVLSFFRWNGMSERVFIGFKNYMDLFKDTAFLKAFSHNVVYALISVPAKIILALIAAIALSGKFRGVTIYRAGFFTPMIMSYAAVGLLWSYVFDANFGLIHSFLDFFKVPMSKQPLWLGSTSTALISIIIVDIWRWFGYQTIIYIASIQGISQDLYEAAIMDGVNTFQKHRYITIPMLRTSTILNLTLCISGSLGVFDLVYTMTDGGPNRASEVILTYMYKQTFVADRFGYASAITTVLLLLIIALTIVQIRTMMKED